jgi:hypothetical protein
VEAKSQSFAYKEKLLSAFFCNEILLVCML